MSLTTLTTEQLLSYRDHGLIALRSAVPAAEAQAMAHAIWETLERRHGVRPSAPQTWTVRNPSGFGAVAKTGAFAAMASPAITGALDDLLGAGWVRPARWGVALVTFPDPTLQWDVPHLFWHLDTPATPESPAVARVFVILEPMAARGGGTMVVTGSHRVYQSLARRAGRPLRSSEANRRLRAEQPWFAALSSAADKTDRARRYMSEGECVDGVPVRVVEMTGQAGDAFLMHPSLLHTPSANVNDRPRMMLTQWIDGHARIGAP